MMKVLNKQVPRYWGVLIVILAVLLLATLFATCGKGSMTSAHAADLITPRTTAMGNTMTAYEPSAGLVAPPEQFTAQGRWASTAFAPKTTRVLASYCWTWTPQWYYREALWPHKLMYSFGGTYWWCPNKAQTRVLSMKTHMCKNFGGYYSYEKCTKQRGGLGYAYLTVFDQWYYHFGIAPFVINRSPNIDMKLLPDGRITGYVVWG